MGDRQVVELRTHKAVTWEDFCRAFREAEPDVVHLIATGVSQTAAAPLRGQAVAFLTDTSGSMGQGGAYSQKIERFVEGQPLVFLNACQTGRTANADAPQSVGEYFWKPAEGLASAFLYGGALGCVGSLWPMYDDPAAEFAIEFYNQVLEGQMLGEAMRLARRTTRDKHPDSITWASFVLYGDPTYRLVR